MAIKDRVFLHKVDYKELTDQGLMPVDMHLHTAYSDGITTIKALVKRVKKLGIGVCVSDHNEIRGSIELSKYKSVFSIPSIEVNCKSGRDLLIYFYDKSHLVDFYVKYVKGNKMKPPFYRIKYDIDEVAELAKKYSCVISAAHPFGIVHKNLFSYIKKKGSKILKDVDALEVVNAISSISNVKVSRKSIDLAERLKKHITGGSDAHSVRGIGAVVTCSKADNIDMFMKNILKDRNFVVGKVKNVLECFAVLTRIHVRRGRLGLVKGAIKTSAKGIDSIKKLHPTVRRMLNSKR